MSPNHPTDPSDTPDQLIPTHMLSPCEANIAGCLLPDEQTRSTREATSAELDRRIKSKAARLRKRETLTARVTAAYPLAGDLQRATVCVDMPLPLPADWYPIGATIPHFQRMPISST